MGFIVADQAFREQLLSNTRRRGPGVRGMDGDGSNSSTTRSRNLASTVGPTACRKQMASSNRKLSRTDMHVCARGSGLDSAGSERHAASGWGQPWSCVY